MSTYHASANRCTASLMSQQARNIQRAMDAERAARGLVLVESNRLADLIGYESPEWEAFWQPIPDDVSNVKLLGMLQAKVKELCDAAVIADWQDDRQLYADLRRGG